MKTLKPSYLSENDVVWLVSPAKFIDEKFIIYAKNLLESWGLVVKIGRNSLLKNTLYAGSDFERLSDFQAAIDDVNAKAIFCARGGYGAIRIINKLNWDSFNDFPKWIVGFSDITIFHSYLNNCLNFSSLHASMPLNFEDNSTESLQRLKANLFGELLPYDFFDTNSLNVNGVGKGVLVGGNLSVYYSLMGTFMQNKFANTILFIEDLTEMKYHIDRMLYSIEYSKHYKALKGIVVGSFTDIVDGAIPFELSVEEIILHHFTSLNIPILFDFPSGHIVNNNPLILGSEVTLFVGDNVASLSYE